MKTCMREPMSCLYLALVQSSFTILDSLQSAIARLQLTEKARSSNNLMQAPLSRRKTHEDQWEFMIANLPFKRFNDTNTGHDTPHASVRT